MSAGKTTVKLANLTELTSQQTLLEMETISLENNKIDKLISMLSIKSAL